MLQSAFTISGRSPNIAILSPQQERQPLTPSREPIRSQHSARVSSSLTILPRAVAQQSARTTLSERTVEMLLSPSDTEGPIFLED